MSRYLTQIVIIGLVFFSTPLLSQTTGGKLYMLENDEADKPKILTLYQNNAGIILCGTTKGLYRFDGFDFLRYDSETPIKASITSIFETRNKQTYMGFSNGNIAELKDNIIRLLHFEEGFPKVAIKSITEDSSGIVWLGTAGEGLYYIKNNRLSNINTDDGLSDNYIYKALYLPGYGVIAASDRGINICMVWDNKKYISTYTSRDGLPDNIVRSISLGDKNELWLGMQDSGITRFTKNIITGSKKIKWNYGQVNDLVATNSKMYVATEDSSLVVFNYDETASSFNKTFSDHTISKLTCLLKDREGNIWAAGENELLRTGKTGLEVVYRLTAQQAQQVHCLHYTRDSALWFNIEGGVTRLHKLNNEWASESFKLTGFSGTTITTLYEDPADNLWVGSLGKGITIFNHKNKTQYRPNEPLLDSNNAISITGSDSIIWISGLEGVVRANLQNNKYTYANFTDTAGIGNKYVYDIFSDSKKRVWFATDGAGISILDDNKFYHLKNRKGYTGNVVYKIIEDSHGNIWYATYDKGVVEYDGKKYIAFTIDQGLSDMNIAGLVKAGNYIAVVHKNLIDIIDPATGKINYLDKSLAALDINTDLNTCTSDKNGAIYFVSGNNIYSYTIDAATVQQPTVSIDKVELFLKAPETANSNSFKYNQNNLSFYFTGIYYSEPERIQYQYKLSGYDKEWIDTKDHVKSFSNLQPGDYTFRVRVSLNKNFSSANETSFAFTIDKPFWMKAWFVIAAAILLGLLFYLFIKQRERHINNLNTLTNEKTQSQLETLRSQVNPHFLFNSFNTLISEIETNPEDAVIYVERMADFYRSIIQLREKDIIPLQDELNILRDYSFLQEKRFASGLEINVDIDTQVISSSYIPPLVLQMLVENAIKHNIISKEVPLRIVIKNAGESCLAIINNINRKMKPETRSGLGLENIHKRYALLGEEKVIVESDEHFFTVRIPLIKKEYDKGTDIGR